MFLKIVRIMSSSTRQASQLVGPFRLEGEVIKGFGRGSRELGIPTANFNEQVVSSLPSDLETGIYFAWTQLENDCNGIIRKAVVSIGWNPYYDNSKKSVETHVMHTYDNQFYGKWLKVLICGYIRPEKNYDSLRKSFSYYQIGKFEIFIIIAEDLIDDIHLDINQADNSLDEPQFKGFFQDGFFKRGKETKSQL